MAARSTTRGLAFLFALSLEAISLEGQAQTLGEPRFEVASVRVADRNPLNRPAKSSGNISGGPGTDDPERITYQWVSMDLIVQGAFGLSNDQILKLPDWTYGTRFDILAKLAPGTTRDQANQMMRNLLEERFRLASHNGNKDVDAFDLVVANGRPKLKEPAPPDGPPPARPNPNVPAAASVVLDRDHYPTLAAGYRKLTGLATDGVLYVTARATSLTDLVGMLRLSTGARITDKTGLIGAYDFKLRYGVGSSASVPSAASEPAPDVFTALEQQLGLKLEKTRIPLDLLVIDHLDQKPSDN